VDPPDDRTVGRVVVVDPPEDRTVGRAVVLDLPVDLTVGRVVVVNPPEDRTVGRVVVPDPPVDLTVGRVVVLDPPEDCTVERVVVLDPLGDRTVRRTVVPSPGGLDEMPEVRAPLPRGGVVTLGVVVAGPPVGDLRSRTGLPEMPVVGGVEIVLGAVDDPEVEPSVLRGLAPATPGCSRPDPADRFPVAPPGLAEDPLPDRGTARRVSPPATPGWDTGGVSRTTTRGVPGSPRALSSTP
jgi:hypothetical protein